jgi:hypothetical protein
MSLNNIPGFIGYHATRLSSFDGRALGKFTDTNHLYSLHDMEPGEYDKKIISIYTQTSQYNNDFLSMINQSSTFYSDNEYWQWKIDVPYRYPTIIAIPASTSGNSTPGIAGQVFEIVMDRKAFYKHQHITADVRYGQQFYITEDPTPYVGRGWLYKCTLVSTTPLTDYVSSTWLQVGLNMRHVETSIGEFDQEMPGLPEMAQTISLYETMAAGYGVQHSVSKWASQLGLKDGQGNPKNVMVYTKYMLNEFGKPQVLDMRWESYIESLMRKEMMDMKVKRFIWSKPGTVKTEGSQQEVKKSAEGLYWKMRNYGNRVTYNRGEFSINLMRSVFGDLFYRREDIQVRKVRVYTNEGGMQVFNKAAKEDAMGAGLVFNVGDNDKFVSGKGQNLKLSMNFSSVWTLDTGDIEIIHLKELDQPQTNEEFGQNKKSTPIYLVFDISPNGDGTPKNNVREVRLKGAPSMTWGYINGRTSWQGHQASQGMISSSMAPQATVWMEDRCDIFVEDLSRMVIIEENPQY